MCRKIPEYANEFPRFEIIGKKIEGASVSIVIPNYNSGEILKHVFSTIKQVMNRVQLQVLVVDDNSSDSSVLLIRQTVKDNENVQAILFKQNSGNAATPRNAALQFVTGQYVYFLDADDWLLDQSLPEALNLIQQEQGDVLVSQLWQTDSLQTKNIFPSYGIPNTIWTNPDDVPSQLFTWLGPQSFIIKTQLIKEYQINFLNLSTADDHAFFAEVLYHSKKTISWRGKLATINRLDSDNGLSAPSRGLQLFNNAYASWRYLSEKYPNVMFFKRVIIRKFEIQFNRLYFSKNALQRDMAFLKQLSDVRNYFSAQNIDPLDFILSKRVAQVWQMFTKDANVDIQKQITLMNAEESYLSSGRIINLVNIQRYSDGKIIFYVHDNDFKPRQNIEIALFLKSDNSYVRSICSNSVLPGIYEVSGFNQSDFQKYVFKVAWEKFRWQKIKGKFELNSNKIDDFTKVQLISLVKEEIGYTIIIYNRFSQSFDLIENNGHRSQLILKNKYHNFEEYQIVSNKLLPGELKIVFRNFLLNLYSNHTFPHNMKLSQLYKISDDDLVIVI